MWITIEAQKKIDENKRLKMVAHAEYMLQEQQAVEERIAKNTKTLESIKGVLADLENGNDESYQKYQNRDCDN